MKKIIINFFSYNGGVYLTKTCNTVKIKLKEGISSFLFLTKLKIIYCDF